MRLALAFEAYDELFEKEFSSSSLRKSAEMGVEVADPVASDREPGSIHLELNLETPKSKSEQDGVEMVGQVAHKDRMKCQQFFDDPSNWEHSAPWKREQLDHIHESLFTRPMVCARYVPIWPHSMVTGNQSVTEWCAFQGFG